MPRRTRSSKAKGRKAKTRQHRRDTAHEAEQFLGYVDPLTGIDVSLLPTLPDPNPQELPILDRVWHVIHFARWSPAAMVLTTDVLGLTQSHLKTILGPLWGKVYAEPSEQQPLSMTVIQLLDMAITKVATKLAQRPEADRTTTKQEAKAALESAPKRRREAYRLRDGSSESQHRSSWPGA